MKIEENKEHEFCLRCGRKLKNSKTRIIGLGPICERKVRQEKSRQLFDADGEKTTKKGAGLTRPS